MYEAPHDILLGVKNTEKMERKNAGESEGLY